MDDTRDWEKAVPYVEIECKSCGGTKKVRDPKALQRWRQAHGVSQRVLALNVQSPLRKEPGVHWTFIANVENGKRPCPDWLEAEYKAIPDYEWPAVANVAAFEKFRQKAQEGV